MNRPDPITRGNAHRADARDHDSGAHDGHRQHGHPQHGHPQHGHPQHGHRQLGLSGWPFDGHKAGRAHQVPGPSDLSEILAPFVAWLATQELDEAIRRTHRQAVERFLRWSIADAGPARDRRRRYEHHLDQHDPTHLAAARAGLSWWDDHRRLLALTLPTDHR